MRPTRMIWVLLGLAAICGIICIAIANSTIVPSLAKGSGPDAVQVTGQGWLALIVAAMGASGFSLAGLFALGIELIAKRLAIPVSKEQSTKVAQDTVEFGAALAAYTRDPQSRSKQRRMMFAASEFFEVIPECVVTDENGVLVIRYAAFADPTEQPAP